MQQFKIGDWVKTKAGHIKQISWLTGDECDTLSIGDISVGINVVFKNEIELWKPKEGEWVIPDTKTTESFSVFRYTENYKGFKLQPFFGELPSFLKEHPCSQLT